MKTLFHLFRVLLLLAAILPLTRMASAQPSSIVNGNGSYVCPGRSTLFSANAGQGGNGCSVQWTVTNGTTLLQNPGNPGNMSISFSDIPRGVATLQATFRSCTNAADNGVTPLLTLYIRSITNEPLGAITLNGSTSGDIQFGSTDPVTLEVPFMSVPHSPNEPNPVPLVVQGYEVDNSVWLALARWHGIQRNASFIQFAVGYK